MALIVVKDPGLVPAPLQVAHKIVHLNPHSHTHKSINNSLKINKNSLTLLKHNIILAGTRQV